MRGHAWISAAIADAARISQALLRPKAAPPLDLRSRSGSVRAPRPRPAGVAPQQRVAPSARELWPVQRDRLLASRPVIGWMDETDPERARPIYGKPTYRNVLENGELR